MKVTAQSELMKNYITGSRISAKKSLRAVYAEDQSAMLFSLDENNAFTLTMASVSSPTGWMEIDLGDQLKNKYGFGSKPKIQCFSVIQNSDGTIMIVIAVSNTIQGHSKLFVSKKFSNNLLSEEWNKFSSHLILRELKDGLVVTDLDIGGSEDNTLVIFVASKPGEMHRHFQVNPDTADSSWTYMPLILPQNVSVCLDAKVGVSEQYGIGVYALCKLETSINLSFTSLPVIVEGHVVTNSVSLLVPTQLQPNTMAVLEEKNGYTELYVAGNGLYRFSVEAQQESNLEGLWITQSSLTRGIKQLHIANDVSEKEIRIWANNESDTLVQIFGTMKNNEIEWGQPLYIDSEVTTLTAYCSKMKVNESIDSGLAFGKSDGSLYLLLRDNVSNLWKQQSVVLPHVDKVYEISNYVTRIQFFDNDNIPIANQIVDMQASFDCPTLINGKYYALKAAVAKSVEADGDGIITVIYEAHELLVPEYSIIYNKSKMQINPSVNVMKRIHDIKSGKDIARACRSNGKPLFPNGIEASSCDNAAQIVAQLIQVQNSIESGATKRAMDKSLFQNKYQITSQNEKDFLVDAGDLFMSLISRVHDFLKFRIKEIANDIWEFIIDLGEQCAHFIFTTVSQVISAINWSLESILGIDFDDIVEWLGFVFNWEDILQNHRVIGQIINLSLDKVVIDILNSKEKVHEIFNKIREQLVDDKIVLEQSDEIFKERVRHQPQENDAYDTPQANWAIQQFKNNTENITTSQDGVFDDISELFKDLTDSQITIIKNAVDQIQTQVVDNFNSASLGDIISLFVDIVGSVLINTVENVTLTFVDAAAILVKALKVLLNIRWNIPVISYVYEEIICNGDGSKLTLLDAVCLFISIPATVIYKTINKKNMFLEEQAERIKQAENWKELMHAFQASEQQDFLMGQNGESKVINQQLIDTSLKFLLFSNICRMLSLVAYTVRETSQGCVKNVVNEFKVGFDWGNYCFSVINLSISLSFVKTPHNIARCVIDSTLTTGQLPIRIKDTYLAVYKRKFGVDSSLKASLCYIESVLGVGMAIAAAVSLGMQIQEEEPEGVNQKAWRAEYILKFIQNFMTGTYRSIAFVSTFPDTVPYKKIAVIVRGVMLSIRAASGYGRYILLKEEQFLDIDS
ncbi:hypothetical protein [Anaeromicropila populeti]|uniref:Uncharacterized protein n=1 Tax=Anaeromicropila populeti TaxID=37658 RepID=A0A1I6KQI4_9FIRM|nr:hypothetical protein [Anaeromicropila populeti]SFR93248.1 hypothetical protein SAMN05661086_02557 [Anaeromicropila populeti]